MEFTVVPVPQPRPADVNHCCANCHLYAGPYTQRKGSHTLRGEDCSLYGIQINESDGKQLPEYICQFYGPRLTEQLSPRKEKA